MPLTLLNVFGIEYQEDGRARVAGAPFRVIGNPGGMLPNFVTHGPRAGDPKAGISKQDYARCIQPMDKRIMNWIWGNCDLHAPFVNEHTSLAGQLGKYHGKTVLLVLPGPSAAGIERRIAKYRDHPDFYVATLNYAAHAVKDPDFFCCFEQLLPVDYFEHLDPAKTCAITTPMQGSPEPHKPKLAEMWGGRNIYYAYMGDMRQPTDERWDGLPMLFSALHTPVAALQALYHMGFSNILLVGADYSMSEPSFSPDAPVVDSAIWYFDGTRYNPNGSGLGKCYYDRAPLQVFFGIGGEHCAATDQLITHMRCTEVCMQIIVEAGVDIRNCSGQGILDYRTANLEQTLDECFPPDEDHQGQHAVLPDDPTPVSTAETVGV